MSSSRMQELLAACDGVFEEVADALAEAPPRDGWRPAREHEHGDVHGEHHDDDDDDDGDDDDGSRAGDDDAEAEAQAARARREAELADDVAQRREASEAGEGDGDEVDAGNVVVDLFGGNAAASRGAKAGADAAEGPGKSQAARVRKELCSDEEIRARGLRHAVADKGSADEDADGDEEIQRGSEGWLQLYLEMDDYWLLQEQAWEESQENNGEDGEEGETAEPQQQGAQGSPGEALAEPKYSTFSLRVVGIAGRTGFEETKELKVYKGMKIAGRYEVEDVVGEAAFSTALRCVDRDGAGEGRPVCCKVIKNSKDFVDQSLDEIRLLRHLNARDPDAKHVVELLDFFYHKEHLFLVTELLGANLFAGWSEVLGRLSVEEAVLTVASQCLAALDFVHGAGLIHCDIKPENILVASLDPLRVKLIDFGSSCFATDRLSSYIQSRFYRAPEVVLGLPFDARIDLWSLGCVLAELRTGQVLFEVDNAHELLTLIVSVLGPIPRKLLRRARFAHKFILNGVLYQPPDDDEAAEDGAVLFLYPKRSSLASCLPETISPRLLQLLEALLTIDPADRKSARELLALARPDEDS